METISKITNINDFESILKNNHIQTTILYGKSYSGKTYLLSSMLKLDYYKKYDYILYLTGQISNDVVNIKNSIKTINHSIINENTVYVIYEKIIKPRQQIIINYVKKNKKIKLKPILFIFDDFINLDDNTMYEIKKLIKSLSTMGRHIFIDIMILSQNLVQDVEKITRSNTSLFIATKIDDERMKMIYDTYFKLFKYKDFVSFIYNLPRFTKIIKVNETGEIFILNLD